LRPGRRDRRRGADRLLIHTALPLPPQDRRITDQRDHARENARHAHCILLLGRECVRRAFPGHDILALSWPCALPRVQHHSAPFLRLHCAWPEVGQVGAPSGATVVMDAGIATEANLTWLRAQGYHYVVVSRLRERQFDPALATEVRSAGQVTIKIHRVLDAQGHALLYCHSPAREVPELAHLGPPWSNPHKLAHRLAASTRVWRQR
jgi:hypothetical protein